LFDSQDRSFGEIDVLFEHKIPARKFKYTKADREYRLLETRGSSTLTSTEFATSQEQTEKLGEIGDDRKLSTEHLEQV
jgi:SP family general alpha glucoside:H+ symporter-like MFS transporter